MVDPGLQRVLKHARKAIVIIGTVSKVNTPLHISLEDSNMINQDRFKAVQVNLDKAKAILAKVGK